MQNNEQNPHKMYQVTVYGGTTERDYWNYYKNNVKNGKQKDELEEKKPDEIECYGMEWNIRLTKKRRRRERKK